MALAAENTWVVEYMGGHLAALSDRPPRFMRNQTQLITYDRLAGDLPGLWELLKGPLAGVFGGADDSQLSLRWDLDDRSLQVDIELKEFEVRTVIRNGSDIHHFSGLDFCR